MLKLSIKKEYYCWCCDYNSNTGEGNLARIFVNNQKKQNKNKIKIFTPKKIIINKFLLKICNHKYISPFIGIFFCWISYIKNKTPVYINYLPLWNIFLFILLPPNTIFGPITGGAYYKKDRINIIRKYIFPILFFVSNFFLKRRNIEIFFSTELLKPYLSKSIIKKSYFNYVFKLISLKKKKKKKIDFLIYYRKHKNKENFFPYNFIKKIIKLKFKIYIVGDRLNLPKVKNCGYVKNHKVLQLQSISKYTIISGENPYSFFLLECLSNHVKVIVEKKMKKKLYLPKKRFIKLDFNSLNSIKRLR